MRLFYIWLLSSVLVLGNAGNYLLFSDSLISRIIFIASVVSFFGYSIVLRNFEFSRMNRLLIYISTLILPFSIGTFIFTAQGLDWDSFIEGSRLLVFIYCGISFVIAAKTARWIIKILDAKKKQS